MKKLTLYFLLFVCFVGNAQSKKFERMLKRNIKKTVPIVRVSEINLESDYVILDTRELREYKVSSLPKAIHVGYDYFNLKDVCSLIPDKETSILVYCSIGMRSELVGEKLLAAGYKEVYNLYGGIFEWKNQNQIVLDSLGNQTNKVHTFSKEWSRWLEKGIKVYEY